MQTDDAEFRRNGGALIATIVGQMTNSVTVVNFTIGVFVHPLAEQFGWSRQDILTANSIITGGAVVASAGVAWLADKISLSGLIIASQVGAALGLTAVGLLTMSLSTFYALFFFSAVIGAGALPVSFTKILASRFIRHRGLALGICLAGSGLCGVFGPPYAAFFVREYGWRIGFVAVGALPLFLAMPFAVLFLHRDKVNVGPAKHAQEAVGTEWPAALRSPRLWMICGALFLGTAAGSGLGINLVPLLIDQGYSAAVAANMAAAFGMAVIFGRILIGGLSDKFWGPLIAAAVLIPAAIATLLLTFVSITLPVAIIAISLIGLAMGAEGDLLAYLVVRYFGLRNYGKIYTCGYIFFTLGLGVGAPLFGRVFDVFNSYRPAALGAAIAWVVGSGLFLALGAYPIWPPSTAREAE